MKKNPSKKLLIILVFGAVLLGIFSLIYYLQTKPDKATLEKDLLVEIPGLPKESWDRKIEVINNNDGTQTAINLFDGFNISAPENWEVEIKASPNGGLKIFFVESEGTFSKAEHSDFDSGLLLNILLSKNPEGLNITSWLKKTFPERTYKRVVIMGSPAYRREYLLEEDGINKNGVIESRPIKNSKGVDYVLRGRDNIFIIRCWALSTPNFQELLTQCENQIPTFRILKSNYDKRFLKENRLVESVPYKSETFDMYVSNVTDAGRVSYLGYLKPGVVETSPEYNFRLKNIKEEAEAWIKSQGVNPNELFIEWTTEDPEYYIPNEN